MSARHLVGVEAHYLAECEHLVLESCTGAPYGAASHARLQEAMARLGEARSKMLSLQQLHSGWSWWSLNEAYRVEEAAFVELWLKSDGGDGLCAELTRRLMKSRQALRVASEALL